MLEKNLTFGGAFFINKYSLEFKLNVVKFCIEKFHSSQDVVKKFGSLSPSPVKE